MDFFTGGSLFILIYARVHMISTLKGLLIVKRIIFTRHYKDERRMNAVRIL